MTTEAKNDGYKALTLAVIESAVNDFKQLTKANIIKGGKCYGGEWPEKENGNPIKYCGHYTKKFQVEELIYFIKSDALQGMIEMAGFSVSADTIRQTLGIK